MNRIASAGFTLAFGLLACSRSEPPPAQQKAAAAPRPEITNHAPVPKPIDARPAAAPHTEPITRDLDAISSTGRLDVLFTFNSTGYFIYRGQTMGYEYELLTLFARESKLTLRPVVVRDSKDLFNRLNRGEGDVVAAQLAATTNQSEVGMTDSLYATAPVVVQRVDKSPAQGTPPAVATAIAREERETTPPSEINVKGRLVSTPAELAGHEVHVPKTSPYRQRLLELNDEMSHDIDVVEVDESSDKLIQRLAEGNISYTVAAENLARLKAGEYTNLVIKPAIGPPQPVVWAVRRNAPQLLGALNRFLAAKRASGLLAVLYRKYFLDRAGFRQRGASQYLTAETGKLSPFDDAFREFAKVPGWDWRLVAAQAYQESRFDPRAHSWAGAMGLMQIMPITARQMKINPADPAQAVRGACSYLLQLDGMWRNSITDEAERRKFVLGSYNVGIGHIQDAVRLAEKNHDNPRSWRDVGYWLIRESTRSVYNDPVVRHGFARGTEPVAYVDEILSRWDNYKEFVRNDPGASTATGK